MCGGDLDVQAGASVGACLYCGSQQTLPGSADEQKANLFNRANHLRRGNNFDRAVAAYETLLNMDDQNAEAHWGLLLSRFGIEYVEDPRTGERAPTCHRMQRDSILTDADYRAALEYAPDMVSRELYEREAARIAEIQRDILAISAKEAPYDVFICYKETDDSGQRTPDSALAQDVYYALVREGYRVFFSRITLESKLGQQYEPYIFAALHSAKVMLVIGTKPEHLSALWVKNEWSRYLGLMKADPNKLLIPCYRGMDPYDLPEELSLLQSQDMRKIGFLQDLLHGVGKVLRQPKSAPTAPIASMQPGANSLLKRAFLTLEDGEWQKADSLLEQVLNLDPESSKAYIGKLMIELQIHFEKQLAKHDHPLNEYNNYKKALRFADKAYQTVLEKYNQCILERLEDERLEQERQDWEQREAIQRAEEERLTKEARIASIIERKWDAALNGQTAVVEWILQEAEQGSAEAQYRACFMYLYGKCGVVPETDKAIHWCQKATEQGHPSAQGILSALYFEGLGVKKDYKKAVEWSQKAAEQGDTLGQCILAGCYSNGYGIKKDDAKAVEWWVKAANQGYVVAQRNLGIAYIDGKGVEQDFAQAAEWLKKAANQGCAVSRQNLGIAYARGNGVEQDFVQAAEWLMKAAGQGDEDAVRKHSALVNNEMFHISKLTGECIIELSDNLTFKGYHKAAEQGNAWAQYCLGLCYRIGRGTPINIARAAEWFFKAAEQGHAEAEEALGQNAYDAKNYKEAAKWYLRAAEHGNKDAKDKLNDRKLRKYFK